MILRWFQNAFEYVERLNFHQYALLVIVIVAAGLWCMRGFGSRNDY